MSDNISPGIYILTQNDLAAREDAAYRRGVERGRFEASVEAGRAEVARNCANWEDGCCNTCGAQHQGMEVSEDYKCPNFRKRISFRR